MKKKKINWNLADWKSISQAYVSCLLIFGIMSLFIIDWEWYYGAIIGLIFPYLGLGVVLSPKATKKVKATKAFLNDRIKIRVVYWEGSVIFEGETSLIPKVGNNLRFKYKDEYRDIRVNEVYHIFNEENKLSCIEIHTANMLDATEKYL